MRYIRASASVRSIVLKVDTCTKPGEVQQHVGEYRPTHRATTECYASPEQPEQPSTRDKGGCPTRLPARERRLRRVMREREPCGRIEVT
jgi:hypothetical protein